MRWKKMIRDAKWILSFEIDIFFIKQSKENHTSVHTCCYFQKRLMLCRFVWSWNATNLISFETARFRFVDLSYTKTYEIFNNFEIMLDIYYFQMATKSLLTFKQLQDWYITSGNAVDIHIKTLHMFFSISPF